MESSLLVDVVSVFTDEAGGHGNALGLVRASALSEGREQEIAALLGFSETVFVEELIEHGAHREAVMRIFTPGTELPFAGHPSVGCSWWLDRHGTPVRALRVPAGEVLVRYAGDLTWITGRAEWAPEFEFHQLASAAEVEALDPADVTDGRHYSWAWIDEQAGHVRSRMFAPALGIAEDEATGAAAVRLTTLLQRDLLIDQGAGSRLLTRHLGDGSIEVGGRTRAADPVRLVLA
ncbi:PhzF family phenazine biosynthesis protein [Herbiconiux moechotypicola]|uniref:PhzF family phenazine biosynthesis isomerase n=1 Tax=Herbiconiux moechotypicola TaxID=637393 RepID=A0ABN3D7W1_9MICO|nr:PhzF family phenazine biosynthesis protein [Herbiconiux moechotypicola]MCS5728344.1 PhzF family phenazine biosynthesis protein [Herbiconiux moechotypicola]